MAELQMDELSEITATVQHHLGTGAELVFAHDTRLANGPYGYELELVLLVGFG